MSKVILDISMSLDGFVARPDDDPGPIHDWLFNGDTVNPRITTSSRPPGPSPRS
jgi:hypothetical protein